MKISASVEPKQICVLIKRSCIQKKCAFSLVDEDHKDSVRCAIRAIALKC